MERNWAGNVVYRADAVEHPESIDEVRAAISRESLVRVLGTRHCFNDIADTDGTLLALDRLPLEIDVSEDRESVRVSSGARYGDIAPVLEAQGLALSNLASLPHISVGGAVATGTHGSGDQIGSLASTVRALTILTAGGEIRRLARVVLDLTLDVEPTYQISQHVYEQPRWDTILDDLDAVTGAGTSVSVFSRWQNTEVADQIWVKQRQPDERARERAELMQRLGATAADGPRHPIIGVDPVATSEQGGVAGPWFQRLPHFRLEFTPSAGAELQSEYLVPRTDAVAAIEAVRSLADRIAPLLLVNEVRTVRADELWLSSSYGTDAVGLHFTWRQDELAVRALLPDLEAALPTTTRPHWGKVFTLDGAEVRSRYPRWDDFTSLRDEFDPQRRFVNAYLERLGV